MVKNGGIQQRLCKGNALQKYRSTVIGNLGIKEFLLYEFSATVISLLPGTFGVYARRLFMPLLFNRFGRKITMHKNVTLRRPHRISIGDGVILERGVTLDVKTNAGYIEIHDDVHIGRDTILSCPAGTLVVCSGARIGRSCRLGSLEGMIIGRHSLIDDFVCIVGAGHAYCSNDIPIIQQPLTCKGRTVIEDYVVIEKEVTVLDGTRICINAKVKAGSLVNKKIEPNSTVIGVPAYPC